MPFFVPGDLVIVFVVVAILVIFRQLDSKNRSLDKVKRLGDKLMAELDAITQEKAAQLKDMSIEVEVHQQTSKAAIERLVATEIKLGERASLMEEMQVRIDSYDTALRELITMTQKAEENITRLRDESAYIDKVGRRIRQAAGQLQQLQDRLPQMIGEFEASNHNSLTATGEQVVASIQERLENLQGQLDMSNRSAAESIQRLRNEVDEVQVDLSNRADAYRRAFDDIEQNYHSRLEEVARQGVSLQTDSLRELTSSIKSQVAERYQELAAHLRENQTVVHGETDAMQAHINEMRQQLDAWDLEIARHHEKTTENIRANHERTVENIRVNHEQTAETIRTNHEGLVEKIRLNIAAQEAKLTEEINKLSVDLEQARGGLSAEIKYAQGKGEEQLQEVQLAVRQLVEATRGQLAGEVEAARKVFGEWQMELQEVRLETEQELRQKMTDSREGLEGDLRSLGGQLEQVRQELEYQIADAQRENLKSIEDFQVGLQSRVDGLDSNLYQIEQDMAGKLGTVQEKAQALADHLLMRMNQDVDAKTESMREAINRRVEQVNSSVKASHDQIDVSFNELRGRVDSWITTSRDYMSQLDEQIRTLNEESRSANLDHKATIESHITSTQDRLNSYEHDLTTRVLGLENSITRAEETVNEQFERINRRAEELAEKTGTGLEQEYIVIRQELGDQLTSKFGLIRDEIEQGRAHLQNLADQARQHLEGLTDQTRDRILELRSETEANLLQADHSATERMAKLDLDIKARISATGEELLARFDNTQVQARSRIDNQIQELKELVRETHVAIDAAKETQGLLVGSQGELAAAVKDHQERLEQQLSQIRHLADHGQAELQRTVQSNLSQLHADLASQLDDHAALMAKRVQAGGQALTEQAKLIQADMDQWRDGLTRQVEELRSLAQGLHQDTLGNVQSSITAVQKQAQDLYNRINTEIATSLNQHEEKILSLTSSSEGDVRRLQALSLETQARISAWQDSLGKTEAEMSRDIQEIRDNTRNLALKGNEELLAQLKKRQDEIGLVLEEVMNKLKSDIAHSKGDVEQDVGFLQQQIDQWKGNFQEHLRSLQESSKKIEEQALVGLSERIDALSDEARALTRKAQDDFSVTIGQHQAQIQIQLDAYNADLRRVQGVNKDIQGQLAELDAEVAKSKNQIKDNLAEVQIDARRQSDLVKAAIVKELEDRHKSLSGLIKQAGEAIGTELAGNKTNLDRDLALMQQTLDQARAEISERVKLLTQDGSTMRRETMAGFQERIDALRDEVRKLTGNVKTEISQLLAEHQSEVDKHVKTTEAEFHRLQDLSATSTLRFQEIQEIFNKAETVSRKEFEDLRDKAKQMAEATRLAMQADLQKQRDEAMAQARQGIESITAEVAQARKTMQAEAGGLATEFEHYSADLRERFTGLAKQGLVLQEQTLKSFQADLAKVSGQSTEIAKTIQEQAGKALEMHRQQIAASLAASADDIGRVRNNHIEIQAQVAATQEDLSKKIIAMESDIVRFSRDMAERIEKTTEEQQTLVMVDVEKRLKDYEKEIAYRMQKIETVNDDIGNLEFNLRQSMDRLTQRLREDLEQIGQKMHVQREQDLTRARTDMESIGLQMVSIEKELDELKQRAYDNVSEKLKVFEDDFFVDLKDRSERMDSRIEEWKKNVVSLLARIEAKSQSERTQLEEQYAALLAQRLEEMAGRFNEQSREVEDRFETFQATLDNRMGAAERSVAATDKAIRDEIQTMEATALAGVQKEFTRMNQDLDTRIRDYEREVESRLQKTDLDFKSRTKDLQEMVEGAKADVSTWQNQVLQQLKAQEQSLGGDVASIRESATQALADAKANLGRLQSEVIQRFKSQEQAVSAEMAGFRENTTKALAALKSEVDRQQLDVAGWQGQVLQQVKTVETGITGDLTALKERASAAIEEIAGDFSRQKDAALQISEQERLAIRKELQLFEERMIRLNFDLTHRSQEALETFNRDYAGFQADFQRQNREVTAEQLDRLKEFRSFVGDAKNEFEILERKLFGKLDDEAKSLDLAMRDIDKRIKDFTAQTKLFDRADILQTELEKRIDQLREEIKAVDEQRKAVLDLDPYLSKVRKLADEVNERMARLQTEKKRLDGLDEDYKRLVSIANVVDQKMAQVMASNDTLTSIQLSLRHLEEVQSEVEVKFSRLDKKSEILDATADGIEKNFQYLQDIEQKLGGIKGVMQDLPATVQALSERVSSLSAHKKEADVALKSVTNLDKILKDVEGRIAELNKSRDWIARTETRFQEITQEAEEKVSLLSTLIKKEVGGDGHRNGGVGSGPAPSVRDVVVKLAQQGWKVDEIARTTKLSRGEVELILEMGGRS